MTDIERIKKILREDEVPFFEDSEIEFYLKENMINIKTY